MWNLRLSNTPFNPSIVYEGHPTLFTIKLYHGGEFTNFRDRKYIDGKVNYVDMVDIDEFSIHDLDAIMRGLRYGVPPFIYYHFLVPNRDFQFGFRPLGNDSGLLNLAQYVADHKLIRVYTQHDEDDEVVESPSKIVALPVSNEANAIVPISPEYNRKRFENQEKVLSSCTKRLIMEEFDIGLYQQILEADSFVHVGTSGTEKVGTSAKEQVEKEQVVIEEIVEDDVTPRFSITDLIHRAGNQKTLPDASCSSLESQTLGPHEQPPEVNKPAPHLVAAASLHLHHPPQPTDATSTHTGSDAFVFDLQPTK
ncbi:hypothetical protein LXL04_017408 [Taraxacum kok-saghyz]